MGRFNTASGNESIAISNFLLFSRIGKSFNTASGNESIAILCLTTLVSTDSISPNLKTCRQQAVILAKLRFAAKAIIRQSLMPQAFSSYSRHLKTSAVFAAETGFPRPIISLFTVFCQCRYHECQTASDGTQDEFSTMTKIKAAKTAGPALTCRSCCFCCFCCYCMVLPKPSQRQFPVYFCFIAASNFSGAGISAASVP